ncbi:MAG: hypothetical protein ACOZQL_20195 [Myxococcota bacterium]
MQTPVDRLWARALSKLQRTDSPRFSFAEVRELGLEPDELIGGGEFTYAGFDAVRADCECGVVPAFDFQTRAADGLVGLACAGSPSCAREWQWVLRGEHEHLRTDARAVFSAIAGANALHPLEGAVPEPFIPVGRLLRRGLDIAVVWCRIAGPMLEVLGRGLAASIRQPTIIVVPSSSGNERTDGFEVVGLPHGETTRLDLLAGVERLTPNYRERVVEDPTLDLDYVRVRFATRPGDRHVLEINGHDFGGFRKSDVKFLRMLLLAAARKNGSNGGWIDKSRLRDGDDKDRALERMREELVTYDVPGLSEGERKALVRAQKGQLRLGVPPENIEFDSSLASIEFIAPTTTATKTGARTRATPKQADGLKNAGVLLRDCHRLFGR